MQTILGKVFIMPKAFRTIFTLAFELNFQSKVNKEENKRKGEKYAREIHWSYTITA